MIRPITSPPISSDGWNVKLTACPVTGSIARLIRNATATPAIIPGTSAKIAMIMACVKIVFRT